MDFFQQISTLGIEEIKINIINNPDGTQTIFIPVLTQGVKDNAVKSLKPFSITDTPKEIDKDFFEHFSKPLQNANSFISNIKQAEARMEEQKKNTDIEKAKKEKAKKLNEAITKILDKTDFDNEKDAPKVRKAILNLKEAFPDDKNIAKATENLNSKLNVAPTLL